VRGERREHGADLVANMGRRGTRDAYYGLLGAPQGRPSDAEVTLEIQGPVAKGSFSVQIGATAEFSRAIHKIALAWLDKAMGAQVAWRKSFSEVRSFVIDGVGERYVLAIAPREWEYRHVAGNARWRTSEEVCVEFVLCGLPVAVDLSPGQSVLPDLISQMMRTHGLSGWGVLPPPKPGCPPP
jgi:hypothetical protein